MIVLKILATWTVVSVVAGLAVAIPSLFGYNYILARVKDATADMHVFIDEFVTKMAEFYSGDDNDGGTRGDSTPLTAAILLDILQGKRSNGTENKQPVHAR